MGDSFRFWRHIYQACKLVFAITFYLKQYPTDTTDATFELNFMASPFGSSQNLGGLRWRYARHSTGHMLATHALAPISFGERGRGRGQCQYFVFNSRSVVRFLSTRYGSYFGSTQRLQFKYFGSIQRFQLKNDQECLILSI